MLISCIIVLQCRLNSFVSIISSMFIYTLFLKLLLDCRGQAAERVKLLKQLRSIFITIKL